MRTNSYPQTVLQCASRLSTCGRPSLQSTCPPKIYGTRRTNFSTRLYATAATETSGNSYRPPRETAVTSSVPKPRLEALKQAEPFSSFLTDTFNRQHDYLRISVTEKCNLRCLYCMPEEGVPLSPKRNLLTPHEIHYLAALFVSQGVTKIRLTGGEPTVHPQILSMLRDLGSLRSRGLKEIALTTNGLTLYRKLDAMVESGVTGINLSLDTLDPFQFQIMTRRKGFEQVTKSIQRILDMKKAGAQLRLKINAVVIRGLNDAQIIPFVEMTRDQDIEVRFIEYMPFDGNRWSSQKMLGYHEMLAVIKEKHPLVEKVQDHPNDTSKTYKIAGFQGRIGFITSMTDHFCGSCNRLRITSDGNLKVCLFGNAEVSLRDMLRDNFNCGEPIDESAWEAMKQAESDRAEGRSDGELGMQKKELELLELIGAAVQRKKAKHAGIGNLEHMKNRPMILIAVFEARLHSFNALQSSPSVFLPPIHLPSTYTRYYSSAAHPKPLGEHASPTVEPELSKFQTESHIPFPAAGEFQDIPSARIRKLFIGGSNLSPRFIRSGWDQGEVRLKRTGQYHPSGPDQVSKPASRQDMPRFTHLTEHGDAQMVRLPRPYAQSATRSFPIGSGTESVDSNTQEEQPDYKPPTSRSATAQTIVIFSTIHPYRMIADPKQAGQSPTQVEKEVEKLEREMDSWNRSSERYDRHIRRSSNKNMTFQEFRATPQSKRKGDVLAVARVAGIQAAKQTSTLIPLCHNISLSGVNIEISVIPPDQSTCYGEIQQSQGSDFPCGGLSIHATVHTFGQTGVEMEALVAASVTGMTVYDMCKAVDRGMCIVETRVVAKNGGRSGDWKLNKDGALANY